MSEPVRPAERAAAGVGSPQPGLDQPVRSGPEAESGAVHGDIQAQRLPEAGRARGRKSRRSHAEGIKLFILLRRFSPKQSSDFSAGGNRDNRTQNYFYWSLQHLFSTCHSLADFP